MKKTKSLLTCGDNLDGTRREGSNWASSVLLADAKEECKVLERMLERATLLADLLRSCPGGS